MFQAADLYYLDSIYYKLLKMSAENYWVDGVAAKDMIWWW